MDTEQSRQDLVAAHAAALGLHLGDEQREVIVEILRTLHQAQAVVDTWLTGNEA